MDLIKLAYGGRKNFNDKRCGSMREWKPGDEVLVGAAAAKKLLKHVEFSIVADKVAKSGKADKPVVDPKKTDETPDTSKEDAERAAALAVIQQQEQAKKDEHNTKEAMLLAISTWDKDQLKDYAVKYEVSINKSRGLQAIREEVSTLVEQFGVR